MNIITEALDKAIKIKDAIEDQPQLLEVSSQQFNEHRAILATSKSEEVRFTRVSEMLAQEVAAIPAAREPMGRLSHLRSIVAIAAAAMPNQALAPKEVMIDEWRAANARIDVLEDENQKLRDALLESDAKVERLEFLVGAANRGISKQQTEKALRLAHPPGDAAMRFRFDPATSTVSQVPL
jgi:hypothetical protein